MFRLFWYVLDVSSTAFFDLPLNFTDISCLFNWRKPSYGRFVQYFHNPSFMTRSCA